MYIRCEKDLRHFAYRTFVIGMFGGLALGQAISAQTAAEVPLNSSPTDQLKEGSPGNLAATGFQKFLGAGFNDWSIFTQTTYIDQWHNGFSAAYDGPNSLQHTTDVEHTLSYSLFLDRKLWRGGELVYNPEVFQGHGLSQTLGVAGFPNGEAVKSGFPNLHYNTSRLFLRQVIGLGGTQETLELSVNQVFEEVDVNRLTFSIGKFAANDFFDGNTCAHDPRTQFMNWCRCGKVRRGIIPLMRLDSLPAVLLNGIRRIPRCITGSLWSQPSRMASQLTRIWPRPTGRYSNLTTVTNGAATAAQCVHLFSGTERKWETLSSPRRRRPSAAIRSISPPPAPTVQR